MKIQQLNPEERPRERCLQHGPECLSLRECLALILGSGPPGKGCLGVAQSLLDRFGPELSEKEKERAFFTMLHQGTHALLTDIKGLGAAGRARLLAQLDFARRYGNFVRSQMETKNQTAESCLEDSVLKKISKELRHARKEWIGFIPVYAADELGEFCLIERGVRSHVNFEPKELFSMVFALKAEAFFLIHNHPSGNTQASNTDYLLTHEVSKLGTQLNTPLLGHCIVSSSSHTWIVNL